MDVDDIMDDDDLENQNEDDNWDDWEDESCQDIVCFFCQQTFKKAELVFEHCYNIHGFSVRHFCTDREQLSYIRLVNFLRGKKPGPSSLNVEEQPWLASDEFLHPVDPEDRMLQFDVDDFDSLDIPESENGSGESGANCADKETSERIRILEDRVLQLEDVLSSQLVCSERMRDIAQTFMSSGSAGPATPIQALTKDEDSGYVQPYGHYSIHQEMLQDKIRTGAYGQFILENHHIFKDKIILDIGCGTGILSLFAAKAGARKVFAVDQSDIYAQARDIVHENGYDDVISVIHGKLEDLELPVEEVDVIVSEWMGYFLLFESMLDTVIFAREKWLSKEGIVYPDQFTINLVGCDDPKLLEQNVDYWDDVYGFKMSCMRELVVREAAVQLIKSEHIATNAAVVKTIDANIISLKDVDFTSEFTLKVKRKANMTAIVGYFDTIFSKNAEKVVEFSTGPFAEPTHWKQTVFLINPPLIVEEGEEVEGSIICRKNPQDPRSLKVCLTLKGRVQKYVVE